MVSCGHGDQLESNIIDTNSLIYGSTNAHFNFGIEHKRKAKIVTRKGFTRIHDLR